MSLLCAVILSLPYVAVLIYNMCNHDTGKAMTAKPIDKKIIDIIDATSFPPVALRIYTLVSRFETDLSEIKKALSMDPVLSAKALQVANSPFFSRGRHTDTLDRALTLIGFNAVRMVVLCAAIHELYKKAHDIDRKLWAHSLGVSLIASILAKESGLVNENNAAAAGLFHDIGKLVLRTAYTDKYSEMVKFIEGGTISFSVAEDGLCGINHCVTGSILAKNWNLSREYSAVIACHHGDEFTIPLDRNERDLLNIISMADDIAFFFGIGFSRKVDIIALPYHAIGLTKKRFDELIWHVNEIYEEHINSLSF
jgi:putative nucleotidyltransferase with HDIG domain